MVTGAPTCKAPFLRDLRFPIPICIFGFLIAVSLTSATWAQEFRAQEALELLQTPSLKGLDGVLVTASVSKGLERTGLAADDLQTDAELNLRLAGIPVLSKADFVFKAPGAPNLHLFAEGVCSDQGCGYSITASLNQDVLLARDPSLRPAGRFGSFHFTCETWRVGSTYVGPHRDVPKTARDRMKDLVDEFMNAYISVNPKNQPAH